MKYNIMNSELDETKQNCDTIDSCLANFMQKLLSRPKPGNKVQDSTQDISVKLTKIVEVTRKLEIEETNFEIYLSHFDKESFQAEIKRKNLILANLAYNNGMESPHPSNGQSDRLTSPFLPDKSPSVKSTPLTFEAGTQTPGVIDRKEKFMFPKPPEIVVSRLQEAVVSSQHSKIPDWADKEPNIAFTPSLFPAGPSKCMSSNIVKHLRF